MRSLTFKGLQFVIEEDNPDVGVYLYVYQEGQCISDHLQDDIASCIEFAFENFDVPMTLWGDSGLARKVE